VNGEVSWLETERLGVGLGLGLAGEVGRWTGGAPLRATLTPTPTPTAATALDAAAMIFPRVHIIPYPPI
jgi:hypothetical protein